MARVVQRAVFLLFGRLIDLADLISRYQTPEVLSSNAALSFQSLVRWGDGESRLALGLATTFQQRDRGLAMELRQLLTSSCPRILLCFPPSLLRATPFSGASSRYARIWLLTTVILRIFARRGVYGDAFLFRKESGQTAIEDLRRVLTPIKRVTIVSSDPSDSASVRDWLGSESTGIDIVHLRVPSKNAYAKRDEILRRIVELGRSDVILLSAGPVGKILAPALVHAWDGCSKVIDTGHLFDHWKSVCELAG